MTDRNATKLGEVLADAWPFDEIAVDPPADDSFRRALVGVFREAASRLRPQSVTAYRL